MFLDGTTRVILRDVPGDVTAEYLRGAELSVRYASVLSPKLIFPYVKVPESAS